MSRIEFEQINDSEIEVIIPPETPMEMVQQLTKSFIARGLVEDLKKSTLSVRYFYRPEDTTNLLADKLIKSLQQMTKGSDLPYWHPKSQLANQKRVRDLAVTDRRAKLEPKKPEAETHITPASYTAPHPKIADTTPGAMNTAGGTGKRYAYISDPVKKEEHPDNCECGKCELDKSDYGPKNAKLYNTADNVRRKSRNVEVDVAPGPNANSKAYSTKPGQLSAKASAELTARIQAKANKKQPVKQWTPEEIEAENKKRGLKKSWGQHLPFPSAEEEIMKLAKNDKSQQGEDALANQLANMMVGKAMLGAPPPGQPTDEQLFGHLVVTEEMAKANEQKWQGAAFNWLAEAAKPISQKFASEEEELAYWNSIKVADRDDREPGY